MTFQSYVYCYKRTLTPDLRHVVLSARVLDNLAMLKHFHQKRERVEKKVIFDPVEALGATNLFVFLHRCILDKDIFAELENLDKYSMAFGMGICFYCSEKITGRQFQGTLRLLNQDNPLVTSE